MTVLLIYMTVHDHFAFQSQGFAGKLVQVEVGPSWPIVAILHPPGCYRPSASGYEQGEISTLNN
jgi:hypothetical protein